MKISTAEAVRTRLDNSYVFDFIDAPFPATYAKGIDAFYKVATYSWWQKHTPQDIKESWQWIADYMRENGPYDAVCTFSQGGHVMSAMALYHAMQSSAAKSNADKPEPLPFRSAIFICGGIPLPILEDLSLQVPPRAYELCDLSSVLLHEITAKLQLMASNRELISLVSACGMERRTTREGSMTRTCVRVDAMFLVLIFASFLKQRG